MNSADAPLISAMMQKIPTRQTTVTPSFYQPTSTIISMAPGSMKGGKHVISYATNPGIEETTNKFQSISSSSTITHLDSLLRNLERLERINRDMSLESQYETKSNDQMSMYQPSEDLELTSAENDWHKLFQQAANNLQDYSMRACLFQQ